MFDLKPKIKREFPKYISNNFTNIVLDKNGNTQIEFSDKHIVNSVCLKCPTTPCIYFEKNIIEVPELKFPRLSPWESAS